jgi:toxin ParE1/3/4
VITLRHLSRINRFYTRREYTELIRMFPELFDDTVDLLSNTPVITKKFDYITSGYQKFTQGSYIIFYRTDNKNNIQIVVFSIETSMCLQSSIMF